MRPRSAQWILLWGTACSAIFLLPARADYVTLKSGGEIRGELLTDPKTMPRESRIQIRTLSGATVAVHKDEVAAIVRRRLVIEEYQLRLKTVAETVQAHWELAEWCRQKSLSQERSRHLESVVRLDDEHVLAHRALGHIRDDQGRWTTRDELMASRGYVKHKGKHVLPQELQAADQQERSRAAERTWLKQIKLWQGWLESDREERHSAAVTRLNAIRDPDAIPALVKTFRVAPAEEHRLLLVAVLAVIEGDQSQAALIVQSLVDDSRAVRIAAVTAVRRKEPAKAVPLYLRALQNPLNQIVNRAGSALGQLGDERVIPYLIEALLTRHEYRALVRDDSSEIATAETLDLVTILGSVETKDPLGKSTAKDASTGSAAFDSESDEFEVNIAKEQENPDVLSALALLTSRNFGYDVPAWRKWHNDRKNGRSKSTP